MQSENFFITDFDFGCEILGEVLLVLETLLEL